MRRKTAEQRSAEHGNALHDYCEADRAKRDGVRRSCVKSACVSAMPVIYSLEYGALAQLVVRYIRIVEARGSTPLCSTIQKKSELNPDWEWVRISLFLL